MTKTVTTEAVAAATAIADKALPIVFETTDSGVTMGRTDSEGQDEGKPSRITDEV